MRAFRVIHWRASWLGLAAVLMLGGCAETELVVHAAKEVRSAVTVKKAPTGVYKIGKPYQVAGLWYYPAADYGYAETGIASWYGKDFHGKLTANGEAYDMNAVTAAHKTLPLPSMVRVTNLENGRSIKVRINDRGPFVRGRIIDMSRRGAQLLGFEKKGTAKVRVEILPAESRRLARGLPPAPGEAAPRPEMKAVPRVVVTAETLAPPGADAPSQPPAASQTQVTSQTLAASQTQVALNVPNSPAGGVAPASGAVAPVRVTVIPVGPSSIFVQVGAFAEYENANRLRARLSSLGDVQVSAVDMGERKLFRVRVGPLTTVAKADHLLARIVAAGYADARLIVIE